jgi:hypothetical protein
VEFGGDGPGDLAEVVGAVGELDRRASRRGPAARRG